jgi:hypothetical protein
MKADSSVSIYKGATREAADSSKVTGQVVERVSSPKAHAIPWLPLKNASDVGEEASVAYQADYCFYGAGNTAQ